MGTPTPHWSYERAVAQPLTERVQELAKPRELKVDPDDVVPASKIVISESEQRARAEKLSKPKADRFSVEDILDEMALLEKMSLENRLLAQAERKTCQRDTRFA